MEINFFQSIFEFLVFIFSIVLSFYLPGKYLSRKLELKLTFLENIFFNTALGLIIFTLLAYFLSWLNALFLLAPLLLIIAFLAIKGEKLKISNFDSKDKSYLIVILIFSFIFSLTMILSGQFGNTFRFIGANNSDSYWHLSLINELKAHFPPDNPGFAGVFLKGYHFFFNFVLAKISNLFNIAPLSLYFHFFPSLISFLWGLGVYVLMLRWSNNRNIALWAVFLTLFGGSFSFVLRLQGHNGLSLDDAFGMTQPASSLVNPPFAISIVIIIATLFSLLQYLKTRKNTWLVPVIFFAGLITMFKVYAGMIIIGGLISISIFEIFRKRYMLLISLFPITILFLSTYWIFRDPSSRLFFYPLWPGHKVLEDNLPWYGYIEKQYTYSRLSVIRKLIEIEIYALYVFIIGSLGTRVIGLLLLPFLIIKKRKFPSSFALTIFSMTLISVLIPLFFIQSGKVFEIIQMTWYFLFFSALFASFGLNALFKFNYPKIFKIILFVIIITLTLPSAFDKLSFYISSDDHKLSKSYSEATKFLRTQGSYDSTVLEIPPIHTGETENDVRRWYDEISSPKILALSYKRGYLNNEGIAFLGVVIEPRINLLLKILKFEKGLDGKYAYLKSDIEKGLKENKISYIFSPYPLLSFDKMENIEKIYQNKEVTIYKVR